MGSKWEGGSRLTDLWGMGGEGLGGSGASRPTQKEEGRCPSGGWSAPGSGTGPAQSRWELRGRGEGGGPRGGRPAGYSGA